MFIILNIKRWFLWQKKCGSFTENAENIRTNGRTDQVCQIRRKLSMELVAERAGISRATLWAIERGTPSVSIGMYAAVLHALNNMDEDLLLVAKDDALGRKLQDLGLKTKQRAPKKNLK